MIDLNKIHLKICKVDSLPFAKYAVITGVDFLGVHVIHQSNLNEKKNLSICNYINILGGRPIIVTKIEDFATLQNLIKLYKPYGIQLHYEATRSLIDQIRKWFPDLKVFTVITDSLTYSDAINLIEYGDLTIYDTSFEGGTGKTNQKKLLARFSDNVKKKLLIAGGVDNNMIKIHDKTGIFGFDVQSFIRREDNIDYHLIDVLLKSLGRRASGSLSMSITKTILSKQQVFDYYINNPITDFHIDVSDGTLYGDFNTDKASIAEKLAMFNSLGVPYSIHFFSSRDYRELIDEYLSGITNNPTRIFLQYAGEPILSENMQINLQSRLILSVHHADLYNIVDSQKDFRYDKISFGLASDSTNDDKFLELIKEHFIDNRTTELWFDKDLNLERVGKIKEYFNEFNAIIGKYFLLNKENISKVYEIINE